MHRLLQLRRKRCKIRHMITQEDVEQIRIVLEKTLDVEMGKHTSFIHGLMEGINRNVREQNKTLESIMELYIKQQEQINRLEEEINELKKLSGHNSKPANLYPIRNRLASSAFFGQKCSLTSTSQVVYSATPGL